MNLLETHDLSIGYGEKALATDLNLEIGAGKLIGLVGQNGVGKSTLLRTLCGFQKPVSGSVQMEGMDIELLSRKALAKKFSVVLTERPAAQNLTVLEMISLGRHPYSGWLGQLRDEDVVAIERALEQCQVHYILTKRLYELSDGQLQKVMIARTLAQDTNMVILDEPTSHLDLRNKVEVLDLLKDITEQGRSVLITTHEISLSAKVCDTFWCMDFNAPMVVGNPRELIESGAIAKMLHLKEGIL